MDIKESNIQERDRLRGLYLYFLQAIGLIITGSFLLQVFLNTEQTNVVKIYQALIHLLYFPALIMVLYAFKHVVRINNHALLINVISFLGFGFALVLISKLGKIDSGALFFFLAPIVLYSYSRFVLNICINGWIRLLKFIMHYVLFMGSLFISLILITYVTIYGGRHTYIDDFYVGGMYVETTAEIYIENPPLIFLVAMILFISRHGVNRPVKERTLISIFTGVLYCVLFYGFWQYIDSV